MNGESDFSQKKFYPVSEPEKPVEKITVVEKKSKKCGECLELCYPLGLAEKEGIGFCTILCERVLSHHTCKCPEEYYKRKLELEEKKE